MMSSLDNKKFLLGSRPIWSSRDRTHPVLHLSVTSGLIGDAKCKSKIHTIRPIWSSRIKTMRKLPSDERGDQRDSSQGRLQDSGMIENYNEVSK